MADLLPAAQQLQISDSPGTSPRRRRHGTWLSVVALAVGLAAVVTLLAVIGQSAGAAGGCGGG
jgi:ferric-dicitrate binding protein FerR (iron transport regulator)